MNFVTPLLKGGKPKNKILNYKGVNKTIAKNCNRLFYFLPNF